MRESIRVQFVASCFFCAALGACSRQKPPSVAPPPPTAQEPAKKAPKRPFAGTVNVPQRRAVRGSEMTTEIARKAREILDGYSDAAYGTEVPFEIDGHRYIGRIEEHYHEPGGPKRPWGRHRGVTVYHGE